MTTLNKEELIELANLLNKLVKEKNLPSDLVNYSFKREYLDSEVLALVGTTPEEVSELTPEFGIHSCNGGWVCIGDNCQN
ncbi:hypothetical protein ACSMDF_07080 [Yersinia enterocolitica]